MAVELDEERRERLVDELRGFWLERFDEELSAFRAEQLVEHLLESLAPHIYNQAVQDARVWMQRKLDDLDGEVWSPGPS